VPTYILRDRDRAYGEALTRRIRVLGIRDRPTSPQSPWQNAYAERLIGSIRRECIDHIVVLGERHLRHILLSYLNYYNVARTHLSLGKDASVPRAVQVVGRIVPRPILGGLHHEYVRISFPIGTGYKLHCDVADGGIPISCVLTAASVHDGQVAIPLRAARQCGSLGRSVARAVIRPHYECRAPGSYGQGTRSTVPETRR
jgi:hypothetical protein